MRALDTIDVGANPTFITATAGSVWVTSLTQRTIPRINSEQ